ncbi:MAG TPA: beta/gamma crystallin-related protein [Phenylobacterium sp.]|uniref:beta/gamma crystallin-related protein n=1 Tax=Phenylobacterium sp. TaxID=1871053 RepID=UPI002B7CD9F1|nr:beta/gamma crystallin-related protein [Phenylobacterium sp.]HSV03649.1 beta/gamma crystallin-related protein [Phenylobacterium sp.]
MRTRLILAALLAAAPAALAQPYGAPPGPYRSQCRDIRMNGQFLSAVCQGPHGSGPSSINVASCSTPIGVDAGGALACVGPGGGAPPHIENRPPGFYTGPGPGPGYAESPRHYARRRAEDREIASWTAEIYPGSGFRGAPIRIQGVTPDLSYTGLNDRVRSIRLPPGSGPWLVCADAGFRGRCATIGHSIPDTREIGMRGAISSMRPAS